MAFYGAGLAEASAALARGYSRAYHRSMLGVLHVIDAATGRDCLAQLRLLLGPRDMVASIGPAPRALSPGGGPALGVKALHCPLGLSRLGGLALRGLAVKSSLIHAWSPFAASASAVAAAKQKLPLVLSLPCLPGKKAIRDLRIDSARDRIAVTVPTDSARRVLLAAGLAATAVHVLRPASESPERPDARRDEIRRSLGLGDGDFALVALGEMTRQAGHKYDTWAHAIVMQIRTDFRLILPGSGRCFSQVQRFVQGFGFDEAVLFTHDDLAASDLLAAADAAVLLCERDCGVSDLAAALAAAVPVVASRTPDITECTDGGGAAMLVEPRDPQDAAAALLRLREEPRLAADLAGRGRAFARAAFDPQTVRRSLDRIYSAAKASLT